MDLRETIGLELAKHIGASTIGTDTLYRSQGQIPIVFLKGCGLQDWEIEQVKLYQDGLTNDQITDISYKVIELRGSIPIKYNSCFISYSSDDTEFAEKLHEDLQQKGVRCWFAPENLRIGEKIRDALDKAVSLQNKLLLILSETSIKSDWVEQEVEKAFEIERKEKRLSYFLFG